MQRVPVISPDRRSYMNHTIINLRREELEKQRQLVESQLEELENFEEQYVDHLTFQIDEALQILVPYFKEARQASGGEWFEEDDKNIHLALKLLTNT